MPSVAPAARVTWRSACTTRPSPADEATHVALVGTDEQGHLVAPLDQVDLDRVGLVGDCSRHVLDDGLRPPADDAVALTGDLVVVVVLVAHSSPPSSAEASSAPGSVVTAAASAAAFAAAALAAAAARSRAAAWPLALRSALRAASDREPRLDS